MVSNHWSVKSIFFFMSQPHQTNWNDAEMMLKSFWTSHLHIMNGLESLFYSWTGRRMGIPKVVDETYHRRSVLCCVWCVGAWYAAQIEFTNSTHHRGFRKKYQNLKVRWTPNQIKIPTGFYPKLNSQKPKLWTYTYIALTETYVDMI